MFGYTSIALYLESEILDFRPAKALGYYASPAARCWPVRSGTVPGTPAGTTGPLSIAHVRVCLVVEGYGDLIRGNAVDLL